MSNERNPSNPSKDKQQNDRQNLPKNDQNKTGDRANQGKNNTQNPNKDRQDR